MKIPVRPLILALIIPFNMSFAQTRGRFPVIFSDTDHSLAVNRTNQLRCNGFYKPCIQIFLIK
jgi:hypothetical protein